jgi:hypothetical protein
LKIPISDILATSEEHNYPYINPFNFPQDFSEKKNPRFFSLGISKTPPVRSMRGTRTGQRLEDSQRNSYSKTFNVKRDDLKLKLKLETEILNSIQA